MARFPDGARVVFIGDSLVAANQTLWRITDFYKTHFPHSGIRFFNCGISGGTAATALRFLEENIMVHKPTHAVIATGINDSKSGNLAHPRSPEKLQALTAAYDEYCENMTRLTQILLDAGVEVTLCTPSPYDEYGVHGIAARPGGSALMTGYGGFVKLLAAQKGLPLCDYQKYMTEWLQTEEIFTDDRIHPTPHGYYRIACAFLAFQGLEAPVEKELPDYLQAWNEQVIILRRLYGAEHMLMKDPSMTEAEKIAFAARKVEAESWEKPAFEPYYRCYASHKARQPEVARQIDALYSQNILGKD